MINSVQLQYEKHTKERKKKAVGNESERNHKRQTTPSTFIHLNRNLQSILFLRTTQASAALRIDRLLYDWHMIKWDDEE